MTNVFTKETQSKATNTRKKTFAPVLDDIEEVVVVDNSKQVEKPKTRTTKKPTTKSKKVTKKEIPDTAEKDDTTEEVVSAKPFSSLTSSIIVEGKEMTVSKSFTINTGNLDKLEKLVKAGLFKNSSRALNAILNAVDVDELIGR